MQNFPRFISQDRLVAIRYDMASKGLLILCNPGLVLLSTWREIGRL